jgi:pyridinium-3,5-bisthiocarboxylic acid mononucleotide nickel chelatase
VTRVAWFHCFAGIAGDMALGSLVDAGADAHEVKALLRRLPVGGWDIRFEAVHRGGIAATKALVLADEGAASPPRTSAVLEEAVADACLPERVERRARATIQALATVEGRLHGTPPGAAHLHEVGGLDALVDIVGTAAALEVLGVDEVSVSPVALGTGTVRAAHGTLPNPPPAVVRLLEGFSTFGRPVALELTTPTGAALVRALVSGPAAQGPMPPMTITSSGYGAGTAELDALPNCTQVVVGTAMAARAGPGQPVTVLEATVDDVTGEQLAHAVAGLLHAGAFDAWISPVVMKKGRPGHTVHVLCDPAMAERLGEHLRRATGSFGVRALAGERWPEARRVEQVAVTGEAVRMKVGARRAKPEHDDVARAAAQTGLGLHEVASRAEEAWRRRS